jgi:hypothetical protein
VLKTVAAFTALESLKLAGWRFYFANLHPLAKLGPTLRELDLSNARDVNDNTLWSLTHLTGTREGRGEGFQGGGGEGGV